MISFKGLHVNPFKSACGTQRLIKLHLTGFGILTGFGLLAFQEWQINYSLLQFLLSSTFSMANGLAIL